MSNERAGLALGALLTIAGVGCALTPELAKRVSASQAAVVAGDLTRELKRIKIEGANKGVAEDILKNYQM